MIKIESNWMDLRQLDELAVQETFVHRLDPCIKLCTTLLFVIIVTSFSKYEITGLFPLLFYPVVLMALGNLPYSHLLKRLILIAPFVLFIGLFNPLFDRDPVVRIGAVFISGGWVSFLSITIKLALTVTSALILVATTGMNSICAALFRLGVPKPLVVQMLFMYRYLHVLIEEFIRTMQAYRLRSFHAGEGIRYKAWGSLLGQLLIRTMDRAQRIYQSMLCRGFDGEIRLAHTGNIQTKDGLYLAGWTGFFLLCRFMNIPQVLGRLLTGGF
jgi:cobalt/nickel transport system permease protein